MISLSSTVRASRRYLFADVDDERILLDDQAGEYYGLNELGIFIWERLREKTHVSSIRDDILREYDVDEVQCVEDLLAILEEMQGYGLISVES